MYNEFFGFREAPFSIAPDPRYLYLSERHKEALAHLMYGVQGQGGFIVITGEVGTGKTTVCRCFLESVPDHVDIALVLNPKLSAQELLASICDELQLDCPAGASIKSLVDLINSHLLSSHSQGRHTVLVIDEAQILSADVLEQLRLLTNLETAEKKLLQIVLLGQPELQEMLAQRELRQLSQRITARYHLEALNRDELSAYVRYRMSVAGGRRVVFLPTAVKSLYRLSKGIPRLINLIADRALLGAYAQGQSEVDARVVRQAGREVLGAHASAARTGSGTGGPRRPVFAGLAACALAVTLITWGGMSLESLRPGSAAIAADGEAGGVANAAGAAVDTSAGDNGSARRAEGGETLAAAGAALAATDPRPPPVDTAGAPLSETAVEGAALLAEWAPGNDDVREAYQQLFQRWGLHFDGTGSRSACEFAEQQQLQCLYRQGNWRSLEQLDRPAVLRLFNEEGTSYHLALLELEGDRARVGLGGKQYTVPQQVIDEYWLGDYSILWRVPAYEADPTAENTDKTLWLANAMQAIRSDYAVDSALARKLENASLKEQVIWFQRRNGLVPDGITGPVTLIRINSVLDSTVPRLSGTLPSKQLAHQD